MPKKFIYTYETISVFLKEFIEALRQIIQRIKSLFLGEYIVSPEIITKKIKIYIAAVVITVVVAFLRLRVSLDLQNVVMWWIYSLGVAVLAYMLAYWALYPVHKHARFGVLALVFMYVFVSSELLGLIFLLEINSRVLYMAIFWILIIWFWGFLTALLLGVNILNVSLFSSIPLVRLGNTMLKIILIYMQSVGIFIIYLMASSGILQFGATAGLIFLSIWGALWYVWQVAYAYITRDFSIAERSYFATLVILFYLALALILAIYVPVNLLVIAFYALGIVIFIENLFVFQDQLGSL